MRAASPPAHRGAVEANTVRGSLFRRLVMRALILRRNRMAFALLALLVGGALAAALLTLYADLDRKMSGELRGFGANLIIAPANRDAGATIDEAAARVAVERAGLAGAPVAAALYVIGQAGTTAPRPVVLAGARPEALGPFSRAWKLTGRLPARPGECAAGERLAARLAVQPGSTLTVSYAGRDAVCGVTGIVASGASEDAQVLLPLADLQDLAHLSGRISALQVIAGGQGPALAASRGRLASLLGGDFEVRVPLQVAESSARILLKVRWVLFGVSLLVLVIVGLGVMTTLTTIVLERRKDIAVMKAIGGNDARIARVFLAESASLAVAASLCGYAAGSVMAREIGRAVFGAPPPVRPAILPEVMLLTVLVALAATLFPLRIVRRVEPAAVLKGE